jgi:hypothetical protein
MNRPAKRIEVVTGHLQPDVTHAIAVAEVEGRKAKNFDRVNPKVVSTKPRTEESSNSYNFFPPV